MLRDARNFTGQIFPVILECVLDEEMRRIDREAQEIDRAHVKFDRDPLEIDRAHVKFDRVRHEIDPNTGKFDRELLEIDRTNLFNDLRKNWAPIDRVVTCFY